MSVNLLVFLVSAALWVASYQVARRWVTWLSAALAAAAVIGTLYLVVEWLASEPMVASYTRGDEAMGTIWSYLDMTALGRQEVWEDSPPGYPQDKTYKWWNWNDSYVPGAAPDPKWVAVSDAGEEAFRNKDG